MFRQPEAALAQINRLASAEGVVSIVRVDIRCTSCTRRHELLDLLRHNYTITTTAETRNASLLWPKLVKQVVVPEVCSLKDIHITVQGRANSGDPLGSRVDPNLLLLVHFRDAVRCQLVEKSPSIGGHREVNFADRPPSSRPPGAASRPEYVPVQPQWTGHGGGGCGAAAPAGVRLGEHGGLTPGGTKRCRKLFAAGRRRGCGTLRRGTGGGESASGGLAPRAVASGGPLAAGAGSAVEQERWRGWGAGGDRRSNSPQITPPARYSGAAHALCSLGRKRSFRNGDQARTSGHARHGASFSGFALTNSKRAAA